jgi:predicted enzyme related to lactoylglutathione lyase
MASSLNYDGGLTCALKVTDLEKSIRWYEEVMDFHLLYKMDDMGWCELKTGVTGVNVGLSQVEKAGGDGGATLTFGVEDIDKARKQIEAKDVRFDGDTQTIPDMVRLATFYDPDGNALMMYQDLQRK